MKKFFLWTLSIIGGIGICNSVFADYYLHIYDKTNGKYGKMLCAHDPVITHYYDKVIQKDDKSCDIVFSTSDLYDNLCTPLSSGPFDYYCSQGNSSFEILFDKSFNILFNEETGIDHFCFFNVKMKKGITNYIYFTPSLKEQHGLVCHFKKNTTGEDDNNTGNIDVESAPM